MAEYVYTLYSEDGTISSGNRASPFSLQELQELVGGQVEILPVKIKGIKGFSNVYVVSEDGIYKYRPNSIFPQFYGPVLFANKKLVR